MAISGPGDSNWKPATDRIYVFWEGNKPLTLAEVEAFIRENGHFPGLKSAEAYEREGVDMMELNQKLVEKIGELLKDTGDE